jgi:hypothetical protein
MEFLALAVASRVVSDGLSLVMKGAYLSSSESLKYDPRIATDTEIGQG